MSDNTPEAREAAKRLIALLRDAFDASGDAASGPSDAAPEVRQLFDVSDQPCVLMLFEAQRQHALVWDASAQHERGPD